MKTDQEEFEAVWQICTDNKRLVPKDWNRLYKMLKNRKQRTDGSWAPALPMILAAWDTTLPIQKQLRLKEHIEWAMDEGQINEIGTYLNSLVESDWFHFGEV